MRVRMVAYLVALIANPLEDVRVRSSLRSHHEEHRVHTLAVQHVQNLGRVCGMRAVIERQDNKFLRDGILESRNDHCGWFQRFCGFKDFSGDQALLDRDLSRRSRRSDLHEGARSDNLERLRSLGGLYHNALNDRRARRRLDAIAGSDAVRSVAPRSVQSELGRVSGPYLQNLSIRIDQIAGRQLHSSCGQRLFDPGTERQVHLSAVHIYRDLHKC